MQSSTGHRIGHTGGGWEAERQPLDAANREIGESFRFQKVAAPTGIFRRDYILLEPCAQLPHQDGIVPSAAANGARQGE